MSRKPSFLILILLILCIFLVACGEKKNISNENNDDQHEKDNDEKNNEKEGDNVGDADIYDFYFINKAPIASEKHALDDLIKIYFSAKNIAIDIAGNEIYIDPMYSSNGIDTFNDSEAFRDKEGLIDILEKYNVQKWKKDYTTVDPAEYEDGYGWFLLMQFKDGTVEEHRGSGPVKGEVIPDKFDDFGNELEEFVDEQMKEEG